MYSYTVQRYDGCSGVAIRIGNTVTVPTEYMYRRRDEIEMEMKSLTGCGWWSNNVNTSWSCSRGGWWWMAGGGWQAEDAAVT